MELLVGSDFIQWFKVIRVPERLQSNGSRPVFLYTNNSKATGDESELIWRKWITLVSCLLPDKFTQLSHVNHSCCCCCFWLCLLGRISLLFIGWHIRWKRHIRRIWGYYRPIYEPGWFIVLALLSLLKSINASCRILHVLRLKVKLFFVCVCRFLIQVSTYQELNSFVAFSPVCPLFDEAICLCSSQKIHLCICLYPLKKLFS